MVFCALNLAGNRISTALAAQGLTLIELQYCSISQDTKHFFPHCFMILNIDQFYCIKI